MVGSYHICILHKSGLMCAIQYIACFSISRGVLLSRVNLGDRMEDFDHQNMTQNLLDKLVDMLHRGLIVFAAHLLAMQGHKLWFIIRNTL